MPPLLALLSVRLSGVAPLEMAPSSLVLELASTVLTDLAVTDNEPADQEATSASMAAVVVWSMRVMAIAAPARPAPPSLSEEASTVLDADTARFPPIVKTLAPVIVEMAEVSTSTVDTDASPASGMPIPSASAVAVVLVVADAVRSPVVVIEEPTTDTVASAVDKMTMKSFAPGTALTVDEAVRLTAPALMDALFSDTDVVAFAVWTKSTLGIGMGLLPRSVFSALRVTSPVVVTDALATEIDSELMVRLAVPRLRAPLTALMVAVS